jgi:hypothetical protein
MACKCNGELHDDSDRKEYLLSCMLRSQSGNGLWWDQFSTESCTSKGYLIIILSDSTGYPAQQIIPSKSLLDSTGCPTLQTVRIYRLSNLIGYSILEGV